MKRWLREILKPKPINWRMTISTLMLLLVSMFTGFISGFYFGTGTLPTFNTAESVLVPEATTTTLPDVQTTLSEVDFSEYGFGYNCVDFAWEAMRALAWQGQQAAIVVLLFSEPPYDALLLLPTEDKGWIFIEPQLGATVVKPRVGGLYNGKT
ncbi:hypothetical protein LCGC14_0877740, partial [marine sediment metagenome]